MPAGSSGDRSGGEGLKALLAERGVRTTDFDDWRRIERAEEAAARSGSPREKMVRVDDWLRALGG
jgi:ferredoxin--NADP+ reductase